MPTPPIHFPHLLLSDVLWNHDWEDGGQHWRYAIFTCAVMNRFKRAILERASAIGIGVSEPVNSLAIDNAWVGNFPDARGDRALLINHYAGYGSIIQMQTWLDTYYPYFVEAYASFGAGAAITYGGTWSVGWDTATTIDLGVHGHLARTYQTPWDIAAANKPSTFFRRKRPREISSLSAPGSAGQIARLLKDPVAMPSPPAGAMFGALYIYDAVSGWILWKPPPGTDYKPDVLTLSNGIGQNGDYYGPWLLNDLRDQINRLVVVKTTALLYIQGDFDPGTIPTQDLYRFGFTAGDATVLNFRQGSLTDGTFADPSSKSHVDGDQWLAGYRDLETNPDGSIFQEFVGTGFGYLVVRTDGVDEQLGNWSDSNLYPALAIKHPVNGATYATNALLPVTWNDTSSRGVVVDGDSVGQQHSGQYGVRLTAGTHTVSVGGLTSTFTVTGTPAITSPPATATTSDRLTVAWDSLLEYEVFVDGSSVGTRTSGSFSTSFAAGAHVIALGGASISVAVVSASTSFAVISPVAAYTCDTSKTITFAWNDGKSYPISIDGAGVGTFHSGDYSASFAAGSHSVTVNRVTHAFTVTAAPFVIATPANGSTGSTIESTILSWNDGNTYAVTLDGASFGSHSTGVDLGTLSDGSHTVTVNGATSTFTLTDPTAGLTLSFSSPFTRPDYYPIDGRTFTAHFCLSFETILGPGDTYDAQVNGLPSSPLFSVFDTKTGAHRVLSKVIGDSSLGAPPDAPPMPSSDPGTTAAGWDINGANTAGMCLIQWNVSGGFEYTKEHDGP